jgi:hypothetical protein
MPRSKDATPFAIASRCAPNLYGCSRGINEFPERFLMANTLDFQ